MSFLDVLHCCSLFIVSRPSFSLDLLAGYDAYVAAAAIAIRLKPRPTIRVLSAVETRAVTELGQTASSQLGHGVLGRSTPTSGYAPIKTGMLGQ